MRNSILVFSIGPVQSFIAASRKTEDLWSGSYLLSYIIEHSSLALQQLCRDEGAALVPIFPAEVFDSQFKNRKHINVASLPNRLVCLVGASPNTVAQIAERLAASAREKLTVMCHWTIDHVFPADCNLIRMKDMARNQVNQLLEVYWAIEPIDESNSNYGIARTNLERRLAASKNFRFVRPVSSHDDLCQNGLVCTMCGEREGLSESLASDERVGVMKEQLVKTWSRRNPAYKPQRKDEEEFPGRIKNNEFLCAICLLKRVAREYFKEQYPRNKSAFLPFPSTLDIAGKDTEKKEASPYYAVIMMDGDDMGKWFSGTEGAQKDVDELIRHQEISRRLNRFALITVPEIIEEYSRRFKSRDRCRLVYAGGDDVLAFAPVHTALPIAAALRKSFSDSRNGLDEAATASVSIVIAHAKAPLQQVLETARKQLNQAKSYIHPHTNKMKDAFALCYMAKSGEIRETTLPWSMGIAIKNGKTDRQTDTVDYLQETIDTFRNDLAATALFTIAREVHPLLGSKKVAKLNVFSGDNEKNRTLLRVELSRLLGRAQTKNELSVNELSDRLVHFHELTRSTLQWIHLLEIIKKLGGHQGDDAATEAS